MFSLETIQAMSDRAAREAARRGKKPYVPFDKGEIDRMPPIPFPFLGSHVPEGWEPVGQPMFVDSSGLGDDNEPALSVRQFKIRLIDNLQYGYGYGVVEAGQFQVYVQAFKPPANFKPRRHPAPKQS